jgi:hypothetical protein
LGPYYGYRHTERSYFCPYRYLAVVGVTIALILTLLAKIGFAYEPAGKVIFTVYYYALAAILVDCQVISVVALSADFVFKDLSFTFQQI